jgi:hypothetical protein
MNAQGASAFLDRGERLIWSGRPAPLGYALKKGSGFRWLFGLFFFGFSMFWIHGALKSDESLWLFGIPFVLIGGAMALSPAWYYLQAGRTQFALTDRRAVIDTQGFMRKRVSIPLGQVQFVELMEGAYGIGHVLFSRQVSQGPDHYAAREDGFLAITNAPEVERKLRDAIATYGREPAS